MEKNGMGRMNGILGGGFGVVQGSVLVLTQHWLALSSFWQLSKMVAVVGGVCGILFWLWFQLFPGLVPHGGASMRLRVLRDGSRLLAWFCVLCLVSGLFSIIVWWLMPLPLDIRLSDTGIVLLSLVVLFWNGILRVYLTSGQLGLKWRVIGIVCGWVPILNLAVLLHIIRLSWREAAMETEKCVMDGWRAAQAICHTRYPIVLVHGVFFRDIRFWNYWGRIPGALQQNGAVIYYGEQESAASIAHCGEQLAARIRQIVGETGCEKVNIIAHSKGGLDARYAIAKCGMAPFVASLTTINTPHRGCAFAQALLEKVPAHTQQAVARKYNRTLRRLGDKAPDFLAAVYDLTTDRCALFNQEILDAPHVYYQSVGSQMTRAMSGRFPLNLSYPLVRYYDGANDGLACVNAMRWGQKFTWINEDRRYSRGISHGDMIDLNRENIDGFDVREFYVQLVRQLREMGF